MPLKPIVFAAAMAALAYPAAAEIDTAGLTGQALIDHVVQDLAADGYRQIKIKRRLFGEVRVLGINGDVAREVAFFPNTGRVKRDDTIDWPLKAAPIDFNAGPDFADIGLE